MTTLKESKLRRYARNRAKRAARALPDVVTHAAGSVVIVHKGASIGATVGFLPEVTP